MIGKTISGVIDRGSEYEGVDIFFTDGTATRIQGDGYETSCVRMSDLTSEEIAQEAQDKAEQEAEAKVAAIKRAGREAEEAAAKEQYSKADYETWMDEHRSGWRFRLIMNETFRGAYADLIRDSNRQAFGTGGGFWSTFSIPIKGDD